MRERMRPFLLFLFCISAGAQTTEYWAAPYRTLHSHVTRLQEQVARKYVPELTLIKNGFTIASIPLDAVSATVLKEADQVIFPYRSNLQTCIEGSKNEYRKMPVQSFEYFAWFLDNYIRTVNKALDSQGEAEVVYGVRERKVTTDRALYAFTKLLGAYLEERVERFSTTDTEALAADSALMAAIYDLGRRVFRIDLSPKFDRREVVLKGLKTQPILRDLASDEGGADLSIALDPLTHLVQEPHALPLCRFAWGKHE